jgi:2-deoxy-D-gluconate 3-dehydrogenase
MNNLFDLSGKVAIITGCNTGLGQGMAVALSSAGCHVVGVNRSDSSDTKELVEANGQSYLEVRVDLSDTKVIDSILRATLDKFGRVDVLVNNAGIIRRNDAVDFTEADWDAVMDLNSKSLFFLSQAVAKQFISQGEGGKIINIASMLSFQGGIRVPSYTASKSAVLGLTRLMANEWAKFGICTNAIAPGYMATNNTEALQQDESRNKEILARIPAGRWGTPQDMAGACVFLASSAANYVNGHTLAVDGGWLAR